MEFTATDIADVILIDPVVYEDERGFLMETWREDRFRDAGIHPAFVQDVHSRSVAGTLRGLHYQIQRPQGKLIRVLAGELFDVAVDLRRTSPSFGQWVSTTLSAGNRRMIWVPAGFAHGFQVQSDYADIEYRMTDYHAPKHGRTVIWNDPDLAIEWPAAPGGKRLLSDKDLAGLPLRAADLYA
jgi:dTDP-4-dehydrorhamnose 3,5-epimerase